MKIKRELILLLATLLLVITILNFLVVLYTPIWPPLTGKVTSTGEVNLCLGRDPLIDTIADQSATVDTAFTYQVGVTFFGDNTSISYADNTSLFVINQSGYISFTPTASQVGTHPLLITANDSSGCLTTSSSEDFILTVSEAAAAPAAAAAAAGGGGGGGGGAAGKAIAEPTPFFEVSEKKVKVILKQSQSVKKTVTIVNYGKSELQMEIINPLAEVSVYPEKFNLPAGGEQKIVLLFNPSKDVQPEIYTGTLAVKGIWGKDQLVRNIAIVLEVESERILFDGSIDLAKKSFFPGEELDYTVIISGLLPGEVLAIYTVSSLEGEIIFTQEEIVPVQEQVSFSKSVKLPDNLAPGEYVLTLKMKSGESFATASELFTVTGPPSSLAAIAAPILKRPLLVGILPIVLSISVVVIVLVLYLFHRRIKGRTFVREKVVERIKTITKPRVIVRDTAGLERKLQLLRESYERGYIREESYRKARAKLEELRERMRR